MAGTMATREPEKAPTPAASASTPEPTMFLARLAIVLETEAPGTGCGLATDAAERSGAARAEVSGARIGGERSGVTFSSPSAPSHETPTS
eukprot:scaffold260639_cov36-Tisochrysis_lutea.AAC.1